MRRRTTWLAAVLVAALIATAGCSAFIQPRPAEVVTVDDDDFGTVELYEVLDNAALDPKATGAAAEIWAMFVEIVTAPEVEEQFSSYRVGDAIDSDTLAYVTRDENDPSLWTLAANAAFADDEESLLQTLVHEYGHVLSLNIDQVPEITGACATLELSEGCPITSAHIYAFQQEFWDPYGPDAPSPENDDQDVADAFYEAHEDAFVSSYAATNVTEDFAESFAAFVREDEPGSDSPLAEKLQFFWTVPQYVEFRTHVRDSFGLD